MDPEPGGASRDAVAYVIAHEIIHIRQQREDIDTGRVDEPTGSLDRHLHTEDKQGPQSVRVGRFHHLMALVVQRHSED